MRSFSAPAPLPSLVQQQPGDLQQQQQQQQHQQQQQQSQASPHRLSSRELQRPQSQSSAPQSRQRQPLEDIDVREAVQPGSARRSPRSPLPPVSPRWSMWPRSRSGATDTGDATVTRLSFLRKLRMAFGAPSA
jgi:hypothetical protein